MLNDIWTVMRKELQELIEAHAGLGGSARLLIWVGVLGVFLPLQSGLEMMRSPLQLFTWSWFPLLIVASVIAGAFASERERHTLETLLASRLSDRAILFGKVAAGVVYGWGVTVISILLSLVTFNLAHGAGEFLMYPALIFWGGIGLSLLSALLASGAGILVSLRAPTARQAQQSISLVMMLVFFIPVFGIQALPAEIQARLYELLAQGLTPGLVLAIGGGLAALSAALLGLSLMRFQRHKLILD